jgi:hypothetical protein
MTQPKSSSMKLQAQPSYRIGDVNLSEKWIELVRTDKVSTTTELELPTSDEKIQVTYGVRLIEKKDGSFACREFATEVGLSSEESSKHPTIRAINEKDIDDDIGIKFEEAGGFVAQLQLVRTLRPSPSPGIAAATSSIAPPYSPETDSFVTGPIRLELRPLVGRVELKDLTTPWDIFHNVSPSDTRGHFLLIPTISDEKNWRGQTFKDSDCHDVAHIAGFIDPPGSLCLGYNSIGAAASQNHIHLHIWPCPPLPLVQLNKDEPIESWHSYPVAKVRSIYDFCDIHDGAVEVSYLEYPVFCILLSAPLDNLNLLGETLATCVGSIGDAPYNIVFMNRVQYNDEEVEEEEEQADKKGEKTVFVDVYFFVRSKERADVIPTLKLGMSEMLGVFHAQSDVELSELCSSSSSEKKETDDDNGDGNPKSRMEEALEDVSVKGPEGLLWAKIKKNLSSVE